MSGSKGYRKFKISFHLIMGCEDEIISAITSSEMATSLKWPHKMIEWVFDPNGSKEVPEGIHHFKKVLKKERH